VQSNLRKVIIGTAGHIDHGKTSLVRALTGVDCDRLPEEKRRGITIDLGFASLVADELQIGFVDVPGHERFVKNMLAGAGGIDSVILVVAADESIMPQTREHFAICKLLGVGSGLIAITKSDLVESEMLELVKLELSDLVAGSFLAGRPMLPVSSTTGEGIDALRDALIAMARELPRRPERGTFFRLPIDRAFTMKGFGSVVTGTLVSGEIGDEEAVELLPEGLTSRVRKIEVHGTARDRASAGERTSLNLGDIPLDQLRRGQQLVTPGSLLPSQIITVDLELLDDARELRDQSRIRFHHYSAELLGTIRLIEGTDTRLQPGDRLAAQIRLESPVVALAGDRFVIRRYSPAVTVGGGVVLDPHLPRLSRGSRSELFEILREGSAAERIQLAAKLRGVSGVTRRELRQRYPLDDQELAAAVKESEGNLVAIVAGDRWIHSATLRQLREKAMAFLTDYFTRKRMTVGVPKGEFIQKILPPRTDTRLSDFLLDDLVKEKIIRLDGDLVDIPGRSKDLSGAEGELARTVERRFQEAGLQPPPVSELINTIAQKAKVIEGVVGYLVKREMLVRIAEGVYLHRDAVAGAIERLKQQSGATIDIATFKEQFGLSRKVAIPLLEYLDRKGVTKRIGDRRQVL
jgi:selenocysteine-specific elongation factor